MPSESPTDGERRRLSISLSAEGPGSARIPARAEVLARLWRVLRHPRPLELVTAACVVLPTLFVFLQLRPGLIFAPTTDDGGDNAAHIVAAYYLIHHLLPQGQISGWDPQWWGGFPLYVFYFPLPAVLIALFNVAFSYAVAFKIVTILGTLLLPPAAWAFGRLAGFARPAPALMSISMLAFIFNTSYTIDGGNLASTLAGEFSFTLSVAFGLVFLGLFAASLRTGRLRWLASLLFAATVLCHVVPALFFGGAALLLAALTGPARRSLVVAATVLLPGGLIAAFWLARFAADLRYSSSMGYSKVGDVAGNLFPPSVELAVVILAIVGFTLAVVRQQHFAAALGILAGLAALAFIALPSGTVYNGRWLPFWFLSLSLLAAYAVASIGSALFHALGVGALNEWITPLSAGAVAIVTVSMFLGVLPGASLPAASRSFLPGWVSWNYTGYEGRPGWPTYQRLVTMLLNAATTDGCGRLDYEYSANMSNYFGSTLAPMALPYFTGGCIDSSEGLYYESSTSTPFHFLDQAELSTDASNPVVGIPYQSLDVADGIRHLELTGTKYFLANSATVEHAADADPQLTRIASMPIETSAVEPPPGGGTQSAPGELVLYLIHDDALVVPLRFQPVVEEHLSKATWLETAITWYQDPSLWSVPITTSGPASWVRERPGTLLHATASLPLPKVAVSDIATTTQQISFDVSVTGVPVEVRVPYFPNWQASGATGPYLATPNLMIVVPSAHHVVLRYGTTTIDWLGRGATAIGLGALAFTRDSLGPPRRRPGSGSIRRALVGRLRRREKRDERDEAERPLPESDDVAGEDPGREDGPLAVAMEELGDPPAAQVLPGTHDAVMAEAEAEAEDDPEKVQ